VCFDRKVHFGQITFLGFFFSLLSFFFYLFSAHLSPSSPPLLLRLLLSSFFFFLVFSAQLSLCHFFFFSFFSFCLLLNGLIGSRNMIKIFNTLKGCDCCFVLPLHSFSFLVLRAHQVSVITSHLNLKFFNYSTFYLFIYFINT
jgi:hypothetical protein